MWRQPGLRTLILIAALPLPASLFPPVFAWQKEPTAPNSQPENAPIPQAGVLKVQAPSVVVDVIVNDKKGRSVSGLTLEDFAVYDNNVQQKVVTFVPPLAAAPPPVSGPQPGAPQSGPKPASAREALDLAKVHFITLVLDLGDLQPQNIPKACDAAAEYLRKTVAPEDFVAIYWVDQSLHIALPFTYDKRKAVEAIEQVGKKPPGGRLTASMRISTEQDIQEAESALNGFGSAAGPGAGHLSGLGPGDSAAMQRSLSTLYRFLWTQSILQARAVFVALRAIAQSYQDLPGRKNVVVFSEGFIHSPEAQLAMQAVIDAANRANVAFYVVDARGLTANYGAASSLPEDLSGTRHAYDVANAGPETAGGYSKFDWAKRIGLDVLHDDLGQVAQATGGFYVKNQNDLVNGLRLADRDLREFYTLVYQPTDRSYDGSFHKIKVELLRRGYEVRHRLGYWAIPPGQEMMMTPAAAQLLGALANGSLKPAFTPSVNAALLLTSDGKLAAPVRVSLPGKWVHFESTAKSYRAGVALVLVAHGRDGRLVSVHQRFLNLDFDKKQWKSFEGKDLDINARLTVPQLEPLRVEAILQFSDGTVALGGREIGIPATTSSPKLTSLLLSDRIEPAQGTADPSDPLRGENFQLYLPAQPRFSAADKLTLYFGILDAAVGAASPRSHLRLEYRVKSGATVVMSQPAEEIQSPSVGALSRMLVLKQFDLKGLRPGNYLLEVTVEDLTHHGTASQSASFTVS